APPAWCCARRASVRARLIGRGELERLARELLVALGGVVGEDGHERRRLREVLLDEVVEGVERGVPGLRAVGDAVLDELEAREAGAVEGEVVRAAGAGERERLRRRVGEGRQPRAEDGLDRR